PPRRNDSGWPALELSMRHNKQILIITLVLFPITSNAMADPRLTIPYLIVHGSTLGPAIGMAASDFDRDGHMDVALLETNETSSSAITLLHGTDSLFTRGPAYPVIGRFASIASGDIDMDGYSDIATVSIEEGFVSILSVYLNQRDFTFATRVDYTIPEEIGPPILIADFNGDGYNDIAC